MSTLKKKKKNSQLFYQENEFIQEYQRYCISRLQIPGESQASPENKEECYSMGKRKEVRRGSFERKSIGAE